jgi:hypothetical protein
MEFYDQEQEAARDAKQRELKREQDRADLERLMGTQWGRRFMWELLSQAGVFRLSYTGDESGTAFNEGQRNVGLRQLNEIHAACPEQYTKMLQENQ